MKYLGLLVFALGFSLVQAPFAVAQESVACLDNYECVCIPYQANPNSDYSIQPDLKTEAECSAHCSKVLSNQGSYELTCRGENAIQQVVAKGNFTGAPATTAPATRKPTIPKLNVAIPGLDMEEFMDGVVPNPKTGKVQSNILGLYVRAVYQFLILAGSLIAVTMIMIGGLQYATARGDAGQVSKAKSRIQNAVTGVVLLLLAYNIAFLVDPGTVAFKSLDVTSVPKPAALARLEYVASGNRGLAGTYRDMDCPTEQELIDGVKFFTTAYYKPGIDETGYGGISPMCNIAMQCACPVGEASEASCVNSEHQWEPCLPFNASVDYCNTVTVERAPPIGLGQGESGPVALQTAAIDERCIPFNTVFKVYGSPLPEVNSATWKAVDTGHKSFIGGRRIDLFMGTGPAALEKAKQASGEVTIRICPDGVCP